MLERIKNFFSSLANSPKTMFIGKWALILSSMYVLCVGVMMFMSAVADLVPEMSATYWTYLRAATKECGEIWSKTSLMAVWRGDSEIILIIPLILVVGFATLLPVYIFSLNLLWRFRHRKQEEGGDPG